MNNERSIDTFLSECCISASLSSTWREGERKKGRRRKILRKREGDRTTLERIVSPGGYGVYALKTFWYYANAIKRAESNMVRARAHRRTALSFPMVSSRGTFEKKTMLLCTTRRYQPYSTLNARSQSAGCIKSYPASRRLSFCKSLPW